MNGKAFQFHPVAREEFRETVRWYRARNMTASIEFRTAVSTAVREIAEAPHRWPKYLHGTRRFVLRRFPLFVVYLDEPDFVTIVAIAHSKRKPGYWKVRI
jgi:plasmid stabilization system protein ParE